MKTLNKQWETCKLSILESWATSLRKWGKAGWGKDNYGIDSRNIRGERLIEFAEMYRLRIMNTFFRKRSNSKWTWKSHNGETRHEIDFILCAEELGRGKGEWSEAQDCYQFEKRRGKKTDQHRRSQAKSRLNQAGARKQICSFRTGRWR